MEDLNTQIEIDLTTVCPEDICTAPPRYVPVPKAGDNRPQGAKQQQCKHYNKDDDEEDKEQQTVQG